MLCGSDAQHLLLSQKHWGGAFAQGRTGSPGCAYCPYGSKCPFLLRLAASTKNDGEMRLLDCPVILSMLLTYRPVPSIIEGLLIKEVLHIWPAERFLRVQRLISLRPFIALVIQDEWGRRY